MLQPIFLIAGGLLALQTLQCGAIFRLYTLVKELQKVKEAVKPAVHPEHIECVSCHSIVARYNPETSLCANCDHAGFIESKNV